MSKATTVKEGLIATKWILENVGWCKGSNARSKDGHPFVIYFDNKYENPLLDEASAFCLIGALSVVQYSSQLLREKTICAIQCELPNVPLVPFNDAKETTKDNVIKVLNKAIRKAK